MVELKDGQQSAMEGKLQFHAHLALKCMFSSLKVCDLKVGT